MLQVSKDLSAIQSGLQRNVTTFVGKSLGMVAFSRILSANWTGETVLLYPADEFAALFSEGPMGSPVSTAPPGECRAITKSLMWRKPVDFFVLPRERGRIGMNPHRTDSEPEVNAPCTSRKSPTGLY
jgi:hypothetical protein